MSTIIQLAAAKAVALPVKASAIKVSQRQGSDLVLTLSNGQVITLQGFFEQERILLSNEGKGKAKKLPVAADGTLGESSSLSAAELDTLLGGKTESLTNQSAEVLLFTEATTLPTASVESGIGNFATEVIVGSAVVLGAMLVLPKRSGRKASGNGETKTAKLADQVITETNSDGSIKTTTMSDTDGDGKFDTTTVINDGKAGVNTTAVDKQPTDGKPETKITTERLPDGSTKTTEVTDTNSDGKADSTVETVKHPDGSSSVTTTTPTQDGGSTSTKVDKDAQGNTTGTTKTDHKPDGSSNSTSLNSDGTVKDVVKKEDTDNDGKPDTTTTITTDPVTGNVTKVVETDKDEDGNPTEGDTKVTTVTKGDKDNTPVSETTETVQPDGTVKVVTKEDTDNDGKYDTTTTVTTDPKTGNTTTSVSTHKNEDGTPSPGDKTVTTVTNTSGEKVSETTETRQADNSIESVKREDTDGNGKFDTTTKAQKDAEDTLVSATVETDKDEDGKTDQIDHLNSRGEVVRSEFDESGDGVMDRNEYHRYENGSLVETTYDDDNHIGTDSDTDRIVTYSNDDGRLVKSFYNDGDKTHKMDADGKVVVDTRPDRIESYYPNEEKPTSVRIDSNGDGKFDEEIRYTYDPVSGEATEKRIDTNYDGISFKADVVEAYSKDKDGNDVTTTTKYDKQGNVLPPVVTTTTVKDENGNITEIRTDNSGDGVVDLTEKFSKFDDKGNPQVVEKFRGAESEPFYREDLSYNENGKLETKAISLNGDTTPESIETYSYYDNGRLKTKLVDTDATDSNTTPNYAETYHYDAKGNLLQTDINTDADQNNDIDRVEKYTVHSNGDRLSKSENLDNAVGSNGKEWDRVETYTRNEQGHIVAIKQDNDGDGNTDVVINREVDAHGNITTERQNLDNNSATGKGAGGVDKVIERTYDALGRELTRAESRDGDDTPDYLQKTEYNPDGTVKSVSKNYSGKANEDGSEKWDEVDTNTTIDPKTGNVESYRSDRTSENIQDVVVSQEFDEFGRVELVTYDGKKDGTIDRAEKLIYDENGKLSRKVVDGNGYANDGKFEESYAESYTYDKYGNMESKAIDFNGDGKPETLEKYVLDTYGRISETHYFKDGNDKQADGVTDRKADAISYYVRDEATGYIKEHREDLDAKGGIDKTTVYVRDTEGRNREEHIYLDGDTTGTADRIVYHEYNPSGYRSAQKTDSNGDGELDNILLFENAVHNAITYIRQYKDGDMLNDNGKIDEIEERFLDYQNQFDYIHNYSANEKGEKDQYLDGYNKFEYTDKAISYPATNWSRVERDTDGDHKVDRITIRSNYNQSEQPTREEVYTNVQDTGTEFLDNEKTQKRMPSSIIQKEYDKLGNVSVTLRDMDGDGKFEQILTYEYDKYGYISRQDSYTGTDLQFKNGEVSDSVDGVLKTVEASSIWEVQRDIYGTPIKRTNTTDSNKDGIAEKIVIVEYARDEKGVALGKQINTGIEANNAYIVKQMTYNSATALGQDGQLRPADETLTWNRTPEGKVLERYQDIGSDGLYENVQINRYDNDGKQTLHRTYQNKDDGSYKLPAGLKLGEGENANLLVKEDGAVVTPRITHIYSETLVDKNGNPLIAREEHDSNYNGKIDNVFLRQYNENNDYLYYLADIPGASNRSDTTDSATGNKISHIMFQKVDQSLDLTEWLNNAEMLQKFTPTGLRELRLDNTEQTKIELTLSRDVLAKIAKTGVVISNGDNGDIVNLKGFTAEDKTVHADGRAMYKYTSELSGAQHILYVDPDVLINYI